MNDLISRQAAIDALAKAMPSLTTPDGCGEFDHEIQIAQEAFVDAMQIIHELPSAQPERRWIPCSERLPEHGGRYLISVLDGINRRTTVAPYLPRCKAWAMNGRMAYWKVIAWMSLPEPAKLGGD